MKSKNKVIALVIPALNIGGMQRVASILANHFSEQAHHAVHLIKLTKGSNGFSIQENVTLHEPDFNYKEYPKIIRTIKTVIFLRRKIKKIKPYSILSFGDRYNAFTILSNLGLGINIYISNRMNPKISNGLFIDTMNKLLYPFAKGIIAQSNLAKMVFEKKYHKKNITVIGNPFHLPQSYNDDEKRRNLIINVGRFDDQKNQNLLVKYFIDINPDDWGLLFVGDGRKQEQVMKLVMDSKEDNRIKFIDHTTNIEEFYAKTKIFAFTSTSEGFPNALGEAMAAGCACLSFDCEAGPSDLIDDGMNGFLIPVGDHAHYKQKLQLLMDNPALRQCFGKKAQEKMQQFTVEKIAQQYLDFIFSDL